MTNNTVLILGGTSGIGLETAKLFCKDHNVIIVGRNIQKIDHIAELRASMKIVCNLTQESEVEELVEILKGHAINKIIHCAGIYDLTPEKEDQYRKEYLETKTSGVRIIKSLLTMYQSAITHVTAISSLYTFLPSSFGPPFERKVQSLLEKEITSLKGVIANCVAPGLTQTRMVDQNFSKDDIQRILQHAPGSRMLDPKEIAEKVYELSNQSVINGQVIPVDGDYLRNFRYEHIKNI